MNADDDQSGACLKTPRKMSWQKISLLTTVTITTTAMSCNNSKLGKIPEQLFFQMKPYLLWCACKYELYLIFVLGGENGLTCYMLA